MSVKSSAKMKPFSTFLQATLLAYCLAEGDRPKTMELVKLKRVVKLLSFVRRECSRLTSFSSEVADELQWERHVSLAREGWPGNFHASTFSPPV